MFLPSARQHGGSGDLLGAFRSPLRGLLVEHPARFRPMAVGGFSSLLAVLVGFRRQVKAVIEALLGAV
jgi:hypothetical protein